jgi:type I restriction enzyme M protein
MVTPGRYVGIEQVDDNDVPFEVKMEELTAELRDQFQQSERLQKEIEENLQEVGF